MLKAVDNQIVVDKHLERVISYINSCLMSDISEINEIFEHLKQRNGKYTRALLCIESALQNDILSDDIYKKAACIEGVHQASLLHDDVIDEAEIRRSLPTVNKRWNNNIAILAGDYIIAKVLTLANQCDSVTFNKQNMNFDDAILYVIKEMSEGEMMQNLNIGNLSLSEKEYLNIVEKKTGRLFDLSAACGNMDDQRFGITFQINDDVNDITGNTNTGKNKFNDIRECRMTLPLIHFYNTCSDIDKTFMENVYSLQDKSEEMLRTLAQKVIDNGSIEYCLGKIKNLNMPI